MVLEPEPCPEVLVSGPTPSLELVLVTGLVAVLAASLELMLEELLAPQAPSSSELARTTEIIRARAFIEAQGSRPPVRRR